MYSRATDNSNIRIITGNSFYTCRDERLAEYRQKWEGNPKVHKVERFPIHLDIESTSVCNLKCPFCAGTNQQYAHGMMPFELFRQIIDEGSAKGLYSIKLNFRGEPLLHPQIHEMVAYAKNKGVVDVFFNTNATMLEEEMGKKLINAGLDRLIVSFEGITREVYEANRVGASFESVVSNVRNFSALKKQLGVARPLVRLQTVEITREAGYLAAYRDFWQDYADEITCIDLRDESRDYSTMESATWECPYPWLRLLITWRGTVMTCPFVNHGDDKYLWKGLGTVGEQSIEDIWNGDGMNRIRETHQNKAAHMIEPCRLCSYRGTELLKQDQQQENTNHDTP